MTILSMIAVLAFGALRLGVRSWEKGEKTVETKQRVRIVLNLLQRQFRLHGKNRHGGRRRKRVRLTGERTRPFPSSPGWPSFPETFMARFMQNMRSG